MAKQHLLLLHPDDAASPIVVPHFAKVLNPLLSIEARGRMSGLVYNTWHGISYVKAHSSPNQPNSAAQLAARARLTTVTQDWRDLTQVKRNAWATYAENHPVTDWTGAPLRLTAQNWFMSCNIQISRMGETPITDPPAVAPPDPATVFSIQKTVDDLTQTFTTPTAATEMVDTFLLGPVSTGVDPKIEHATNIRLVTADVQQPDILVLAVASGRWRAWIKVITKLTGLSSTWVSDIVDIP